MLLPTSYPHNVKWYPSNNDVGPNRESRARVIVRGPMTGERRIPSSGSRHFEVEVEGCSLGCGAMQSTNVIV